MDGALELLINLYVFTTGRRLFAIRQVRVAAQADGYVALVKHCDAAIKHDVATLEIERRWAGEPAQSDANPLAQRIDVLVDRALTAIRDHAVAQTQGADPTDSIHAEVEAFVKRIFPLGVQAVTSLPYVDELAVVEEITGLLKGELAAQVKELGLGRLQKRLTDLTVQYREALQAAPPAVIQWGHVRAARAEGQGLLLEAVAIILGKYHERTPKGMAARVALLGPILKQNDAIAKYLRARRAVEDVDPETGAEDAGATGAAPDVKGGADPK